MVLVLVHATVTASPTVIVPVGAVVKVRTPLTAKAVEIFSFAGWVGSPSTSLIRTLVPIAPGHEKGLLPDVFCSQVLLEAAPHGRRDHHQNGRPKTLHELDPGGGVQVRRRFLGSGGWHGRPVGGLYLRGRFL